MSPGCDIYSSSKFTLHCSVANSVSIALEIHQVMFCDLVSILSARYLKYLVLSSAYSQICIQETKFLDSTTFRVHYSEEEKTFCVNMYSPLIAPVSNNEHFLSNTQRWVIWLISVWRIRHKHIIVTRCSMIRVGFGTRGDSRWCYIMSHFSPTFDLPYWLLNLDNSFRKIFRIRMNIECYLPTDLLSLATFPNKDPVWIFDFCTPPCMILKPSKTEVFMVNSSRTVNPRHDGMSDVPHADQP